MYHKKAMLRHKLPPQQSSVQQHVKEFVQDKEGVQGKGRLHEQRRTQETEVEQEQERKHRKGSASILAP